MKNIIKNKQLIAFMNQSLQKSLLALLLFALALYSCKQDDGEEGGEKPSVVNSVTINSLSPQSPATLCLNEKVTIKFSYKIGQTGGARIFIRPLTGGNPTPNYAASGSTLYSGTGEDVADFTITSGTNVHVDQLRIQIYNDDQSKLLSEAFVSVDYTFSDVSVATGALPEPKTLCFNEDIIIPFTYKICSPNGARIFVRPFTNGSLSPAYAASPSPIYQGSGADSVFFTITSGTTVHVDSIRIQVYSADQSQLLHEFFKAVDYTFSNTVTLTTLSPASPAELDYNENVNIGFNYKICDPNGARIFVRPFTNGSLTPNYAASGSPVFVGSGSHTVNFTISSGTGNTTVDSLRVQVYNKNQTLLLKEFFKPVNYTFK